jgi:FkbM family methyltransferase
VTVDELTRYFVNSPEFWDRWQRIGGAVPGRLVRVDLSGGGTLYVRDDDAAGVAMRRQGSYEPHVTREVLRTLRRGSVFVDVGASTGYFTVLAARVVGPEGEVVACEPGPQNQSVLLLNTVVNQLGNVRLVPCAVSDGSAVLVYHRLGGGNGAIAAFDGTPLGMGAGDLVQARRLDDILTGVARVDLVKIDVEGAEGRVLAGASETLRRYAPTLLFEFSPPGLEAVSGVSGEDLLAGLAGLGYRFRVLGAGSTATASAEAVVRAYRGQAGDHIDVIASVSP